jgi:hypothetical protein
VLPPRLPNETLIEWRKRIEGSGARNWNYDPEPPPSREILKRVAAQFPQGNEIKKKEHFWRNAAIGCAVVIALVIVIYYRSLA